MPGAAVFFDDDAPKFSGLEFEGGPVAEDAVLDMSYCLSVF